MKRTDIEKKLKNEAARFTPDPIDKIKSTARAENLLPSGDGSDGEVDRSGNSAVVAKNKRKTVWFVAALALVLICLILILSFTLNLRGNNNDPLNLTRVRLSSEDVYGMGAVSAVKLLGSNVTANAVQTFYAVNSAVKTTASLTTTDDSEAEVKRQAKKFNDYFTALDSFLGEDIISTSTVPNADGQYTYEVKMTITGKDLAGNVVSYIMYYTETLEQAESEDDDDGEGTDDEDDDDDGEETETVYRLEGVMVIDDKDFYLEGERSEESEKDETETELKIRAYADLSDKTSYVQMEQEYSVENGETETEYVYSVFSNGELIEQTAVEFETKIKNNKVETEYELEFRSGASKGKYLVEREVKDNKTEIKVKYNIDGKTGVFRIREIRDANGDKRHEYTFGDNDKIVF